MRVIEATIAQLRRALENGTTTAVELAAASLDRIGFYDRHGITLNAVPVLNPDLFAEAEASDARRRAGTPLGPLDGVPFTAKDSYKVAGLPTASGSPAFAELIANEDAYAIERLRSAGAVLIGLTNMPPMADGGMQRGVYGRAESPYNPAFMPAAIGSGSSNGSGVATASSFAAFGLGEETWSSGRAPASNNALVAYTPSRGVISVRGNWPLSPARDVVVPHTRTVDDLFEVLQVLVADDPDTRGDFWRTQHSVALPSPSQVRPDDYRSLAADGDLHGLRFGVPRMYLGRDDDARDPVVVRDSVVALWRHARVALERLGAEIVEVDFPLVSNYEEDRPGAQSMYRRGLAPEEFRETEDRLLAIYGWQQFLRLNGDARLHRLQDVDEHQLFPLPGGAIALPWANEHDIATLVVASREIEGDLTLDAIPGIDDGLRGLERTRKVDFEDWLDSLGLDALVFPANGDVAPFDSDTNPRSYALAWRNGVQFSNGNEAIRLFGVPTVTVPMGVMTDTHMPVGLTIAGRAYDDNALLRFGHIFEAALGARAVPPRTPELEPRAEWGRGAAAAVGAGSAGGTERPDSTDGANSAAPMASAPRFTVDATVSEVSADWTVTIDVTVALIDADQNHPPVIALSVNGRQLEVDHGPSTAHASIVLPATTHYRLHSQWRGPYGSLVVVTAASSARAVSGWWGCVGGVA